MNSKKDGQQQILIGLSNNIEFQIEMSQFIFFELNNTIGHENFKRKFLLHQNGETLLEIVQIQRDKSVFVGNTVQSTFQMLMFSEVDPLLLAVSILSQARGIVNEDKKGHFRNLDDIFFCEDIHQNESLKVLIKNKRLLRNLEKICDIQNQQNEVEPTNFLRLNNDKLKMYLDNKITKAEIAFSKYSNNLSFYKISTIEEISDALYFGIEFVYPYLPPSLFSQLVLEPRNMSIDQFINFKKHRDARLDFNESQEDNVSEEQINKKKQPPKITTADLKNEKAARNTKSIISFFNKK